MRIVDFDFYKDFLKEKCGYVLDEGKSFMLDSRLTPVARKWKFDRLELLTMAVRTTPSADLVQDIINAMMICDTSFCAGSPLCDSLRDCVLPSFIKKRKNPKHLRIWCAGSSTGQEPYSLAIFLRENAAWMPGWTFEITATDISTQAIATAEKAEYTQHDVQRGLPVRLLLKHFDQNADRWILKPDAKSLVKHKHFNLLSPMASLGKFDIVICRNVFPSFDESTKKKVLANITHVVTDGGAICLGNSDAVDDLPGEMTPVKDFPNIYMIP